MSPLTSVAPFAFLCFYCCGSLARADSTTPFFRPPLDTLSPTAEPQLRLRVEIADELLLMAIGRHSFFLDGLMRPQPIQEEFTADKANTTADDQAQHIQAAITLHLLQQLRFMEAIDEKLTGALNETVSTVAEYRIAMQVFFEMMQRKVEQDGAVLMAFLNADTEVRRWFRELPPTRRRYASVRTAPVRTLLAQLGRESIFLRRLAICTLFLERARAADEQQHAKLAKNVLKLARNEEVAEHVERIFKMAVDETANEGTDWQDAQRALDTLVRKLVDKLRNDVILNSESIRAINLKMKRS